MLDIRNVAKIEAHGEDAVALANLCALAYPVLTGQPVVVKLFNEHQVAEMLRVIGRILTASPVFQSFPS